VNALSSLAPDVVSPAFRAGCLDPRNIMQ